MQKEAAEIVGQASCVCVCVCVLNSIAYCTEPLSVLEAAADTC